MSVSLLTKLDEENGGTGAPSVVTPGLRWLFKGFVGISGGALGSGQFKVNGGALTTYNIGSVIGSNDNPSIDISLSPIGTYLFEYNIEECDFGSTLSITNVGCPTCNTGSAPTLNVCNAGSCSVNLYDHLTGGPDAGGSWANVIGPQTLTFTNGDDGTVNFSGKAVGTYVARYSKLTCYTDVTIIVTAPPNAGNNNVVTQRCDGDGQVVNFETLVGGLPGTWTITTALPPFGVVDLINKRYTPADGDGGSTYATPVRYTFVKTVASSNVVSECASGCNASVTLHVDVYPRFFSGQNALNTVICNDGSQRELRDLLNGEDDGGRWDFFGVQFSGPPYFSFTADLIINGVNSPGYTGTGTNYLFGGADHGTIGFMPGTPAGDYRFRYKRPNQNEICSSIAQVGFSVQSCVATCSGNNPTIAQHVSGNCVNATRGGSVSSLYNESWSYRLSSNGTWQSYTSGTNICGQPYVEFRVILSFSNGCPNIEKTTIYNVPNPTCSNSPTVSGSFASCAFTLTPGGSITSPIASSVMQWRIQGNTVWNTYLGPIAVTGPMTIEYRRVVSYSDGCAQTTTGTGTVSGQCGNACNITASVNSNNNVLTANVTGCGQAGQTIEWRYSVNGSSYGSVIGTGYTYTPGADGYYKVSLACGTCTDEDVFHFVGTPTLPPACAGSMSMSFANNTITANRQGCIGTVTYDWRFSPTGTGWSVALNNANSPNHIPSDGPGFYRVFSLCNGQCLFTGDYQVTGTTCNNTPTATAVFNTGTCQWTITPSGQVQCDVAEDTLWWRPAGSVDLHQYGGPFTFQGNIEIQRFLNCFGDCPDITTPWSSPYTGGTCCNGNSIDVVGSFNQGTCQFTLSPVTNVTSTIVTDIIHWRQQGSSSWNNYTGPFSSSGVIEYERIVTFQGSCGNLTTGVKTISGSCCTGNNPTVSGSYNQNTCQYTITSGGTNTSTIQADVLEWRQTGSSGSYTTYNGAFTGPSSIEIRRRVTYTDGCTATVPGSASGNCCVGNNPSAQCSFDNNACLFTLSPIGTLNSPASSDIIRWRGQGSSVWNTYSAPFANNGVVEFQREVIFSNGCTTIITPVLTCSGTCCSNNLPDVTCSFNGSDCKYTLTPAGTLVSPVNTSVIQYRAVGSGTWLTYSVPVVVSGDIEYRRTVSFTNGCATITTSTKTCSGTCCLGNSPTVSCGFTQATCTFTLTPGGSIASPIASSTIYWRAVGTTVWQVYSAPFVNQTNIEYYRHVTFSNGCSAADTTIQTCTGVCCTNKNPDVIGVFNEVTCKYELTRIGNAQNIDTDVVEYSFSLSGGEWLTYTAPVPYNQFDNQILYRRVVTFTDGCEQIDSSLKYLNGLCCSGKVIGVDVSFNSATCQYVLTRTGSNTSSAVFDYLGWFPLDGFQYNTYDGPFTYEGPIRILREVEWGTCTSNYSNTFNGVCCPTNTPDVGCSKDQATCLYTLTPNGTNVSPVSTDIVEWRASGGSTFTQYTGPFLFPGNIEYRRRVTYTNGCASVTTSTHSCSGTCCTTNAPDAQCSFNASDCKFTLTPTGTNTSAVSTSVIQYRAIGSGTWLTYSVPVAVSAGIEYRRTVTYSDGCASITSAVKTCSGLCCLGNAPDVSCSYNGSTCMYTLTPGGSMTSPIATSVIQKRNVGSSVWTTYTGPFVSIIPIEFRRTVTFSDGCASITTPVDTCSGTCCSNNQPDAQCSFNAANCQFTLSNIGTVTSPIATDKIEYRTLGSGGSFTQYTVPFVNSSGIEYRRVITFSDGCSGITTAIKTCNGVCCLGSNPDVTGSYNTSTCQFTLTPIGSNASTPATDVIEWRPQGTSNWTVYNGVLSYTGAIEFRRTVTYSNGCATVASMIHQLTGVCCTTNNPTISCAFNNTSCQYTLTRGGTSTSSIASDIVYWRPISGGAYSVYSGSFTYNGQIEYYRQVTYSDGCATKTTSVQPCNGACCGNNTPGISCIFNSIDCKYTLAPTGTNISTVVTDNMQYRAAGSGGSWTTYSVPFTFAGPIEAQRLVTYSDACVANPTTTCSGTCCLGNSPDATCAYDNVTCLYTLTPTGSNTSPISIDIIRWRPVGTTPWNTYTGPFAYSGQIEYQRVVNYSNGCAQVSATIHTCSGTCCNGNTPDVQCAFNPSDCKYTLNRIGVNVGTIATDVVQYRASGSSGSWTTYTVPFTFTGAIEYQRIVTYSNGCTTVTTSIHTCSGDCCTALSVGTSIDGNNNLVASVSGCVGTATVNWYYGTTNGNTTTFLGSGTTISPSYGSGWYEARVSCTNGCIKSSTIQFTCASSASLNTSLSTLTVTGLSNCPSPSYTWQYSLNGSTGWTTASGATNTGSLTMANGNGWYRVQIACNGICPITLSYQRDCNCSNNAVSVSAVKTTDFVVTATPSGCSGTTYNWTALNGGSIVSGQGTTAITTNGKGSYFVQVNCNNSCGAGCNATSNTVNMCNCTLTGGQLVSGAGCNSMQVVGLSGCSGTLTYEWTVTSGATILSGQGTTSIGVDLSGNRQATVSVLVTCSDCGSNLCQKTITNQECLYYGIQADPAMVCSGGGGTQCRIGLEVGVARLNQGCTAISSNLNDYWMVYEGVTYYATSFVVSIPGTQQIVYWDLPYTGSCSGSPTLALYYKGCLVKTFTNIVNECINNCAPCSLPLCQSINEYFVGGQGDLSNSFIANGNGTVTMYFTPNAAPDQFVFRKNGSVYYDSGCVTFNSGGFGPTNIYPGCSGTTVYHQPTGATFVSGSAPENPFGIGAWKIVISVSIGDTIGIEINGGCTGCPFVDNQTNWGVRAVCSF